MQAARLVAPHLLTADRAGAVFDAADTYEAGKVCIYSQAHMHA
jgi:hypothetical protein